MLVPLHDAKPAARGVHARLQRVRHVKGPAAILDAARLPVLRPHDVYQRSRRAALYFKVLFQSTGEVALPRRDGAPAPV